MSLPQAIVRGVGGLVYIDRQTRPTSATVDIYTDQAATIKSAAAASVSTISSTLAAAASRGAVTLSITATTGIVAGSVFWIQDDPEPVLVYKVTANVTGPPAVAGTAYLRRPLIKDHVSGAAVAGTRVSYTVAAADAATRFWDGRCKWTMNDASVEYSEIECIEYPQNRRADVQDLWDIQPQLSEVLDPTVDTERLLDCGHEEVLDRLGAKGRARCFTGSNAFRRATALAALWTHYQHVATDDGRVLFDRYSALLAEKLEGVVASTPRDGDQDGVIEERDRMAMRTRKLRR